MDKLKTILFTSILAAAMLSSCDIDCLEGTGNETTEDRKLDAFSRIDLGGAYKLVLTQDSTQSLRIHADENLLSHIKTEVNDGELRVYSEENICDEIEIAISMKQLTSLEASGAVEVHTTNQFVTPEFELNVSGAVEANMDIAAERIRTELSGAGEIEYRGKAAEHSISISGAGELNAFNLVVGKYDIDLSGAAACNIHVLNELNIDASGASSVRYRGSPATINKNTSGAGSVAPAE